MAKRKRSAAVPLLLPRAADEFIGRHAELDKLLQALQPGRTVTLVGEPGIGKRALAAAAIDRLRSGNEPPRPFPAGVVTLSCHQYPNDHLLLSALARALGGAAWPNLRTQIPALLQGKQLLIVIEDVDALSRRPFQEEDYRQIVLHANFQEAAAADVAALRDQAQVLAALCALLDNGQCGLLLTTGDRTLARGEVIELGALSEAEGRALLAVYCEDVIESLQESTDIANLLGGLPLSLVLGGLWLAGEDVPPSELRTALAAQKLAQLSPDKRRLGGLAAVVQLCQRDFDPAHHTALGLLAALAPAPLPAALAAAIVSPLEESAWEDDLEEWGDSPPDGMMEKILAAMEGGMEIMTDLIASGLLVEQGDGNVQYRHFLVQQLAFKGETDAGAASKEEFAAQIAGMIDHLLMFAETAGEDDADLAPSLPAHFLYLQGILYALQNWQYVTDIAVRGGASYPLPAYWYELFDLSRLASRAVRWVKDSEFLGEDLLGAGLLLGRLGLGRDAAAMFAEALQTAEEMGDEDLALNAVNALVEAHVEAGDMAAARQAGEQLLALVQQQDDPQLLAMALISLTQLYLTGEEQELQLPRAAELAEQVLELQREVGSEENLLAAMLNAAAVWSRMGDHARALETGEQVVETARRMRNRESETAALLSLGESYSRAGENRRALRTFEKALEAARRSNDKPLIALSSWRLANSVEQSGNSRAALKYYEQCLAALNPAEVRNPTLTEVQAKIAALRG